MQKKTFVSRFAYTILLSAICAAQAGANGEQCLDLYKFSEKPPTTPREPVVQYDPYRDLETASPARTKWLREQNAYANKYFRANPWRPFMEKFFREYFNEPNVTDMFTGKEFKLELVDRGLAKPMEVELTATDGTKKILFSSYSLKRNGSIMVHKMNVSPDQSTLVVGLSRNGSIDKFELHVIDIKTGAKKEILEEATGAEITWLSDNEFTYGRRLQRDSLSFTHRLEQPQTADLLLNKTWVDDLGDGFIQKFQGEKGYIRHIRETEWIATDVWADGLVGRTQNEVMIRIKDREGNVIILGVDLKTGQKREVVRDNTQALRDAKVQQGKIIARISFFESQQLNIYDLNGKVESVVSLPKCCRVRSFGFKEGSSTVVEVSLQSPIVKEAKFEFDLTKNEFKSPEIEKQMLTDTDGTVYVTEFIRTKSKDGKEVPVRLVYREGLKKDGTNPVMMEGYGGFGIEGNFPPRFNPIHKELLKRGGIYAAPALRGGNEGNKEWSDGSQGVRKQNTFNDFIAATEAIIAQGYTSKGKIGAMGWSNGGLLMGALTTQRPDLFGVTVPGNGVQDMLRKERLDPHFQDGWSYEYGNSDQVPLFKAMAEYSPVANAKKGNYPAVLIVVGNHDSRVNPAHSYKLAAALQTAQKGEKPILLSNTNNSGHWLTSEDLQDMIAWRTNVKIWSTIFKELDVKQDSK